MAIADGSYVSKYKYGPGKTRTLNPNYKPPEGQHDPADRQQASTPTAPPGGFEHGGWYWNPGLGEAQQYNKDTGFGAGTTINNPEQAGFGERVSDEVQAQSGFVAKPPTSKPPTSKDQISPYLNDFQASAFSSESAVPTKTRSMTEIKEMLTPGTAKPEQFSSVEEFNKLREDQGVAGLEEQLNDLKGQEDDEVAFFRQQRFDERGKPVAMNVIQGRIGEEENAAAERMDVIGRQKARITDQLQTSYSLINMMMGFMEGDYNRATESYNTEFNNNLKMYDIFRGEERDARSDFENDRANASANLTTYMNAITSGNMSYDNLDSNQKLMINKLEIQSGMPVGFVSQLQMSPGDKLIQFNDKTGEALLVNADGTYNVVQTGMTPSPKSTSPAESALEQTQFVSAKMMETRGEDGYVDPELYRNARSQWTGETGKTVKDFDDIFIQYANPAHLDAYGIDDPNKDLLEI